MILPPISVKDKNGSEYVFKTPSSSEAMVILDSMAVIAASSPYILSTPESFKAKSIDSQIKWLEDAEKSDVAIIIAAYDSSGRIVGFCNGRSYADIKRQHRAGLGVSLHPSVRGLGLGKKLMEVLLTQMRQFSGIQIIELDVMTQNLAAVKMYEKLGFKRAGVFPKAFIFEDGSVSDNLTMYLDVFSLPGT